MNTETIYKVLLSPHVSEKTTIAQGYNKYAFKTAPFATKLDIKNAVEALFDVKVKAVNISNVKSKTVRFGRGMGKRGGWKKAYVTLVHGDVIELSQA